MKKIVVMIVIVVGIMILIFIGNNFYSTYKHDKDLSNLPDYYQQLILGCETKEGYNCCVASVNNMADGGYRLFPDIGCPDGFQGNMLRCIDSLKWCEPIG